MRRVIASLSIVAVVSGLLWLGYSSYTKKQDSQKVLTNRISVLELEIANLKASLSAVGVKLDDVTGQQNETGIALKELQNRQVVKEKSQSELLTAAVARVAPDVVSIVVTKDVPKLVVTYQNPFGNDPFFKDFDIRIPVYQQQGTERQNVGAGTGFLIDSQGYILTNRHVVADTAANYTVLLADGKQLDASVVYRDPGVDMAIVKVSGSGFGFVTLGNSDSLQLGQTVAAIGNALGQFNNSVSVGIVSGLNRTIEASGENLSGVIQTDAAINPGNSGGPLLDLGGNVVGINVATVIGSNNISFSIPINKVKDIVRTKVH